jgi:hypothetical protein
MPSLMATSLRWRTHSARTKSYNIWYKLYQCTSPPFFPLMVPSKQKDYKSIPCIQKLQYMVQTVPVYPSPFLTLLVPNRQTYYKSIPCITKLQYLVPKRQKDYKAIPFIQKLQYLVQTVQVYPSSLLPSPVPSKQKDYKSIPCIQKLQYLV